MIKSNFPKSKRIASFILSAVMLTSVLTGCEKGSEASEVSFSETSSVSASETAFAASQKQSGKESEKSFKLLENRERISNGLITEVEALSADGKCITVDSEFRITASEDVSPEEIKSRISMSPETEFNIIKEKSNTYLLSSAKPFAEGSLVRLAAADEKGDLRDSWAFQTTEKFRIKSVYPSDGSEYVAKNSGIEVEFSSPADAESAKEHFEITPALKGRFETHKNTLYYVPSEHMKLETVYTVTVKNGMRSSVSGELEEDYTFEFKTGRESNSYFHVYNSEGNFSETFLEGDPAVIEIVCSKELKSRKFDLNLYKYANAEDYRGDFEKFAEDKSRFSSFTADVSGLEKVFSSSEQLLPNTDDWRPSFMLLPDELEEGYYIAEISVADMHEQYMIQVNPVSVYALMLGEENAFFINDTKTGKAAEGAEVSLTLNGKTYAASADKNGVAIVKTGLKESSKGVLSVKYGGSNYIDFFSNYDEEEASYEDKYFMYLYTDREAYLTSDTVNVWGVVLPRRDGVTMPQKLSLRLGESDESGTVNEISVAPDGTFRSQFTFKDHYETWYYPVELLDGENVMCEKRITIKDYVKPTYVVDVTLPDYAIMPQKDPVPIEVSAQFYEGTPAKGLKFQTSPNEKIMTTDENGHAEENLIFRDEEKWQGQSEWASAQLTGVENEYNYYSDHILAFYRDVMLENDYDKETHSLTLKTTQLDFSRIEDFIANNKGYYYYNNADYDILKGKPFDTEITVKIEHSYTVKNKTGTYYDFIEKKTVDKYSYTHKTDNIGTFTAKTVNGAAVLENLPTTSMEGSYWFYITYNDSLGQTVSEREYYSNHEYAYNRESPFKHYYFRSNKEDSYYVDYDYDYYNSYYYSRVSFEENETLDFELICNKDDAYAQSGRIFFAVYQDDFITQNVYSAQTLKYSPSLECLPNARFEGAYFDGRHVYPVSGGTMKFDPAERNVKLEASADKEFYDAGETVRLSVKAVDEQGRPVANAPVMLSVADEAAFAVMNQNVDILADAYANIYYPTARNYYSYIQHVIGSDNMGESGGGGDDGYIRDYFNDNPYFGSVVTDANGNAEFVFQLADNLTTWRAT
ncbi:MAG: Ig-like domain-containing protein, partial [Oscillospiraceae bacterium]|nr:Ig-like domain-containing protein [Oscillospiraceae bacterium]